MDSVQVEGHCPFGGRILGSHEPVLHLRAVDLVEPLTAHGSITTRSVSEGHGIPRARVGLGFNQQPTCRR